MDVPSMSKAAIAVGADGLIMEVHYKPEEAICDGYQSLNLDEFRLLMAGLNKIAKAVGEEFQHSKLPIYEKIVRSFDEITETTIACLSHFSTLRIHCI